MQLAVIEYARNVAGLDGAHSTEFDPETPHPVIALITEWQDRDGRVERRDGESDLGGTMRLGGAGVSARAGHAGARRSTGRERHRAPPPSLRSQQCITCRALEAKGCKVSARTPSENLPEMIELPGHPWFVGCQFHPEFTSTPRDGHPLFSAFIRAAIRTTSTPCS